MPGDVFVVSAPSGAGKTTLCRRLLQEVPGLEFSISHTTRPARQGEREGVDYHFVTAAEFEARRARGEFIEWAQVGDHLYGTAAASVSGVVTAGRDVLLDIDTQGAESIRRLVQGAILIFILPPGPEALRARLEGRGSESEASLKRRLGLARSEISKASLYDYLIVNDDLESAFQELRGVVLATRARAGRRAPRLRAIAAQFDAPD